MDKGKTIGPLSETGIYEAFQEGRVTEESLACAFGSRLDWRPPADLRFWKPLRYWFPKILELPKPKKQSSIEFRCLGCPTTIRVPNTGKGGTLKCPVCGMRLKIAIVDGRPHLENAQEQAKEDPVLRNESENPCQILGVKADCTHQDLKAAYRRKLKEYHPDRVADMGHEIQALAEMKTKKINWAYEQLCAARQFK